MTAPATPIPAAGQPGSRLSWRRCARGTAVALGVLAVLAGRTAAAPAVDAQRLREQLAAFKRIEADLIIEPARREWSERREHLRELRLRRGTRGA